MKKNAHVKRENVKKENEKKREHIVCSKPKILIIKM
jgi:hypothetical protein